MIIGWLIASAVAAAVAAIVRAVRFDDLGQRAGLSGFVQNLGVRTDAASFPANVARWFVRLIVLVTAFDAAQQRTSAAARAEFATTAPGGNARRATSPTTQEGDVDGQRFP